MLSSLTLTNVALIKKQTVEFKNGFNCLLGQSGAGKSIIIDALSFLLGAKADRNLIRSGEDALRVDGVFVDLSTEEKDILREWDIEVDDELVLTRTLSQEGKSTIKVNGYPATAKMLQALSEKFADFCGQHDNVGLLNARNHLLLLDKFAGADVDGLKSDVAKLYDELQEIKQKIEVLGGDESQRLREKELLEYQIEEIEKAHLQLGEAEELRERFDFISSAEKIFESVSMAVDKLDEGRDNVTKLLYEAKNCLSSFSNFKDIEECRKRIEDCYYEIKDVAEVLDGIRSNSEFDPKELERIDSRLDLIKSLSKKYGKNTEEILDYQENCQKKLEELENSQEILFKLQTEQVTVQTQLENACLKLSEARKKCAKIFEERICHELADLQMAGTSFKVDFARGEFTRKGYDSVKFMFSANVGQAIRDLHKTASGGELSRLLLAFKNVMLEKDFVQTVIFDEIDAGVSGQTAGKVAEKLVNISKYTQIICITHTAVVASKADEFLLVKKDVVNGSTISTVTSLDKDKAVFEVARLIDDSNEISETALNHAKKLFLNN